MAYWSIAVLLLSITFLTARYSSDVKQSLPQWFRPAKRRNSNDGLNAQPDLAEPTKQSDEPEGPEVNVEIYEHSEAESTPKANPEKANGHIPSLSLSPAAPSIEIEAAARENTAVALKPPAVHKDPPQIATATPSKTTSRPQQAPSSSLMPPPPRPKPAPPLSTAAGLRVPLTGPLPNRGPPANSQQRANGGLSPNGTVSIPNARGKVLLSPGHSPMDWAALIRKGNLSGVDTFQRVTPSMLKTMTGRKGKPAWSSWQNKVYNITPYLPSHPGGESELMKAAGRDGTKQFMEVHPWVNWENMLGSCLVGVMVPEGYGMEQCGESTLEDMD